MGRPADHRRFRRTAALAGLGFLSGLPAAALDQPLAAWLTDRHATAAAVGQLARWTAVPVTVKFAWAPLLDRYAPPLPGLGRRRAWLAVTQVLVAAGLVAVACVGASATITTIVAVAAVVAVASASQDVVGDAYRTDVLPADERGPGTSAWVTGWRLAAVVAGGGLLVAVDRGWASWAGAFAVVAIVMVAGVAWTVWSPEPPAVAGRPSTLAAAVVDPLAEFARRPGAWAVALFVVLFKLPERLVATLPTKFLLDRGVGLGAIGQAKQGLGVAATIAGAAAGGWVVSRLGVRRALWAVGVAGAVSNLGFYAVARLGHGPPAAAYATAIGVESLCNGLVTAAFLAFLTGQCDRRFSATQFALLSGLMRLTDVLFGPAAGAFADRHGWAPFFLMTVVAVLPGLAVLRWVPMALDKAVAAEAPTPGAA